MSPAAGMGLETNTDQRNLLHNSRPAFFHFAQEQHLFKSFCQNKNETKSQPNKQQQQNLSKNAEGQKSKPSLAQNSTLLKAELRTYLGKEG